MKPCKTKTGLPQPAAEKPTLNSYVAYFRPGGGTGQMQAYPHLHAASPEEAEKQWLEYAKGFVIRMEYWITTEHIHGYTKGA